MQVRFRVVKEMHRGNPWASDWLKRYDKEGMEGLKDRPKIGRLPELPEEISYRIKKGIWLQAWLDHKKVDELIVKKSGIKYHHTQHAASSASGASSRRCQERYMLTQQPGKKKMISKKGHPDTFG